MNILHVGAYTRAYICVYVYLYNEVFLFLLLFQYFTVSTLFNKIWYIVITQQGPNMSVSTMSAFEINAAAAMRDYHVNPRIGM